MFLKKNVGSFSIPCEIIDDDPEAVRKFFEDNKLIVIRAETLFHMLSIEYVCLSPKFPDLAPGCVCPIYNVEILRSFQTLDDGTKEYKNELILNME